jgi:hypothetical protein
MRLLESARRIEADLFSQKGNHRLLTSKLGVLLGYPSCCIESFIKNNALSSPAIILNCIKNTLGRARAELNVFGDSGPLISHIPCSFSCKKSLLYARKIAGILQWDASPCSGPYIYFNNGCFVRLGFIPGSTVRREYVLLRVSQGAFGGRFNDSLLIKNFLNALKSGDSLHISKVITIYKAGKAVFSCLSHSCEWEFIEFE